MLQCVYRLEHEGWDFLFHGVFCFLVFTNLTYTGVMHFYGKPSCMLWQGHGVSINAQWVC